MESEAVTGFRKTQLAAKAFSLKLYSAKVHAREGFETAFAEMQSAHAGAVLVILNPLVTLHSKIIVELAN